MILKSIKWRILSWNFALLAIVVTVLLTSFYKHERENRLQMADVRLRQVLVGTLPGLHVLVPAFDTRTGLSGGPGNLRGPGDRRGPDDRRGPEGRRGQDDRRGPEGRRGPGDDFPPGPPPGDYGDEDYGDLEGLEEPRATGPSVENADEAKSLRRLTGGDVWCAVLNSGGEILFHTDNTPARFLREGVGEQSREPANPAEPESILIRGDSRILLHRHPGGRTVVLGMPVTVLEAEFTRLAIGLALTGVAIVGAGCAVGWILAGRSLRPISRISATAEQIAAGDYERRIDIAETESELGRLAVVLNNTFSGLNAAREQVIRFTADASHELRTPLSVILAGSQSALKRDRSPEDYRETIVATERAARRMKSLSDDLLELARGGAGKEALQLSPCDLADLADEAVAMLTPLAKQHGALITSELESCPVNADPLRLGRVIVNLVSNAILHNGPGVHISVGTKPAAGRAILEVLDTGKGIPAEHIEKIFDRFHRADASRSRNTGGSGLGLAIVKQTVEAHGGSIAVTSEPGKGTLMRVSLPLA